MKEVITTMKGFKRSIREKGVVVFCAGEYCMRFLNRLDEEDIGHIKYIVDNDPEKQGEWLYGFEIKNPDYLRQINPLDTIVVIAVENSIPEVYEQITQLGDFNIVAARLLINDIMSKVAEELYLGREEIKEVSDMLYDDRSKYIYNEAIRRRMVYGECDFRDLIVRGDAEYRVPLVYSKSKPKDEIIIDCGAYNGDTLKKFVETYGPKVKKIYAFECMDESIIELSQVVEHIKNKNYYPEMIMMPYALSDCDGKMKFAKTINPNGSFIIENRAFAQSSLYESDYVEVNVTSLDKVIPEDDKVTFIKMDIEGSEYGALHGAERIITNCKPVLAISIYHSGVDYYRIPLYLKSLVPDYKFAVRHHNKNHCDTDLYCWVEE